MSRAAILKALRDSDNLAQWIDSANIYPNYSKTTRPVNDEPFVILRWQESSLYSQTYTGMSNGLPRAPRVLDVWVHIPTEISTSFLDIDIILDAIDSILIPLEQTVGTDGQTITCVQKYSRSGDLNDDGYKTICRYASYGVLSHKTPVAV